MSNDPARDAVDPAAAATRSVRAGGAAAPCVVIADDEVHIRMVVAEKFRAERYTVIEARDGEEALELVRTHVPDALITDLQMPYMNGLELCARLAEDARTAHIPALLLTARGHIVDRSQVGATVIRRTMAKPFGVKALFETVRSMLGAGGQGQAGQRIPASPAFSRSTRPPLTGEAA